MKTRRLVSLLLCILLTVACHAAFAAGNAARIGTVEYATLTDAVNSVGNGETIVLLQNIQEAVSVANKTATIDLNGKNWGGWQRFCA